MKYGKYSFGQAEAIFNMLGGESVVDQLLSGEVTVTISQKGVEQVVQDFIVSRGKLAVNYARSIADSLKAGKYNWTNNNITDANFPSTETGECEVEYGMFHFNRTVPSSKAVEAEMAKVGYRPATMKELLAYGQKNPDEQRTYPITGLGSVAVLRGARRVGCLYCDDRRRYALLDYYDDDWDGRCRFLGVRIESSVS